MAGPKYVKEFEFPKSAGFSASAPNGTREVRFMARGGRTKVGKVMSEFKSGDLRSGAKTGPVVKSPLQAKAIALSEAGLSKPNFAARAMRPGGKARGGSCKAK